MLKVATIAIAALSLLVSQIVADVDCNSNITIWHLSELDEIRDNCRIIEGDLILSPNLTGNANLSGIETVKGDLGIFPCTFANSNSCGIPEDASARVSSDTLKWVGGSIHKYASLAVTDILLPNLENVNHSIDIFGTGHLESVDLTSLTNVGFLRLRGLLGITKLDLGSLRNGSLTVEDADGLVELDITNLNETGFLQISNAPQLERVLSNGIANFTREESSATVSLRNVTRLRSIGGVLSGTVSPNSFDQGLGLYLGDYKGGIPNLANITLGWRNTSNMVLFGPEVTLTMGTNDTDYMIIETATVPIGFRIERGPSLERLDFDTLSYEPDDHVDEHLETIAFGFDRVRDLSVRVLLGRTNSSVESLSLPPEAEDWGVEVLVLDMGETKFRSKNDDGDTIWHWPKELRNVELTGRFDEDFFESFIEQGRRVSGDFTVLSTDEEIDCDDLAEKMNHKRLGGTWTCMARDLVDEDEDVAGITTARLVYAVGCSVISGLFLLI